MANIGETKIGVKNNFRICVKGQQMQIFVAKGVGRGKKQKSE